MLFIETYISVQRTHYSDAAPGRNTNNHEVDGLRHRASGYGAWRWMCKPLQRKLSSVRRNGAAVSWTAWQASAVKCRHMPAHTANAATCPIGAMGKMPRKEVGFYPISSIVANLAGIQVMYIPPPWRQNTEVPSLSRWARLRRVCCGHAWVTHISWRQRSGCSRSVARIIHHPPITQQ